MKINFIKDKIIIYVTKYNFDISNKEEVENYIKELVLQIKKIYGYKISGSYKVNIYVNGNIGLIIEFIKNGKFDFFPDLIDLKINIFYNKEVYYKTSDYFILKKYNNIYYKDNSFYINVNELIKKDIILLSEFGSFLYNINLNNNFKLLK